MHTVIRVRKIDVFKTTYPLSPTRIKSNWENPARYHLILLSKQNTGTASPNIAAYMLNSVKGRNPIIAGNVHSRSGFSGGVISSLITHTTTPETLPHPESL
jgi:hypothetical protein